MFNGIVETKGKIVARVPDGANIIVGIEVTTFTEPLSEGSSVAVNGCCLTVLKHENEIITFEIGSETLSLTNLSRKKLGDYVNLERPLLVSDRLDGHLVSGHVDIMAEVVEATHRQKMFTIVVEVPKDFAAQIIPKGSITMDGVSLTINEIRKGQIRVDLLPYTYEKTSLGSITVGDWMNLEFDLVGKYIQRYIAIEREQRRPKGSFFSGRREVSV